MSSPHKDLLVDWDRRFKAKYPDVQSEVLTPEATEEIEHKSYNYFFENFTAIFSHAASQVEDLDDSVRDWVPLPSDYIKQPYETPCSMCIELSGNILAVFDFFGSNQGRLVKVKIGEINETKTIRLLCGDHDWDLI